MKGLLAGGFLLSITASSAAQDPSLEYRVKATYLFNFTKFVDWPAGAFDQRGVLRICVAGRNPFGDVLTSTVAGETASGHALASQVVQGNPSACHVLFIPRGVGEEEYLRAVRSSPVLTVGESAGFLTRGGIVNFVLENGKVRFEINQETANRVGLVISSRLLQLAKPAGARIE